MVELMLPVGSWESLIAAKQAHADSVYFGVQGLNMRSASSVNFSIDDMASIADFCRDNGMKSYLTLNTVLYDSDIEYMNTVLQCAKRAAVTAVIISDQAAMVAARNIGLEVHISTQLNISNVESVKFYAQFADVMVLARELELPAVKHIYEEILSQNIRGPKRELIQIEMFAHGALCMAVSGKCYLSLHEANKSANRGECRQICRRKYEITDIETGGVLQVDNEYILSPKDLCTIDFLDKMVDSGVRVLKIEGRARGGEYVRTVGECYRRALDAIAGGTYNEVLVAELKTELARVFNRGFWGGYYLGHKLGQWTNSYGSSATERKVYVGKVTNYYSKLSVAEVQVEASDINVGDKLLFLGATTGAVQMPCSEIRLELASVPRVDQGQLCSLAVTEPVRRGDKLYKLLPSLN